MRVWRPGRNARSRAVRPASVLTRRAIWLRLRFARPANAPLGPAGSAGPGAARPCAAGGTGRRPRRPRRPRRRGRRRLRGAAPQRPARPGLPRGEPGGHDFRRLAGPAGPGSRPDDEPGRQRRQHRGGHRLPDRRGHSAGPVLRLGKRGRAWRRAPVTAAGGGTPAPGHAAQFVVHGPRGWLAVGPHAIWTSTGGQSWTLASTTGVTSVDAGDQMAVLTPTRGGFLAVGRNAAEGTAVIWTSPDGLHWRRLTAAQLLLPAGDGTVADIDGAAAHGSDILLSGHVAPTAQRAGITRIPETWLSTDNGATWKPTAVPTGHGATGGLAGIAATGTGFVAVRSGTAVPGTSGRGLADGVVSRVGRGNGLALRHDAHRDGRRADRRGRRRARRLHRAGPGPGRGHGRLPQHERAELVARDRVRPRAARCQRGNGDRRRHGRRHWFHHRRGPSAALSRVGSVRPGRPAAERRRPGWRDDLPAHRRCGGGSRRPADRGRRGGRIGGHLVGGRWLLVTGGRSPAGLHQAARL